MLVNLRKIVFHHYFAEQSTFDFGNFHKYYGLISNVHRRMISLIH